MKIAKKIFLWLMVTVFLLSMAMVGIGCKAPAVEEEVEEAVEEEAVEEEAVEEEAVEEEVAKREISIIWDHDNNNESQMQIALFSQKRADQFNAERDDINITFTNTSADMTVEKQIASLEAVLIKKPDAVIITHVDREAIQDIVKKIHDAGIKVIDARNLKNPDIIDVLFIGNNEPEYARLMKEWMVGYLEDNPDVVLNTGLLYGAAAQELQLMRCDWMKELAEEMPDRVNILAEQYGEWQTDKAMNIVEDWLQSHNNMNAIINANTGMATGTVNVLKAAGKIDDFLLTGVDLPTSAVEHVKNGELDAVVGVAPWDKGTEQLELALAVIEGTYTEPEYYAKTIWVLTADNIQDLLDFKTEMGLE